MQHNIDLTLLKLGQLCWTCKKAASNGELLPGSMLISDLCSNLWVWSEDFLIGSQCLTAFNPGQA